MSKIKILPSQIANKIAAGEVVERPSSVVKELVENSIDSGASEITVVLEQAGKEMIQVVDNGTGITPEDVPVAFERHATSKIESVTDLDRIVTMGFRGEALPSIASVSRVEMKTCLQGRNVGIAVRLEGGEIVHMEEVALNPGTIISIKNLFYNVPARRNFLRADVTEFNRINKVLKNFFIAQPQIHFRLLHNGKEIYDLPPGSVDERLTQVFGNTLYEGLVYIQESVNEIELEGYVCRPDMTRGNSDNQFIFLNKRAIQNRSLSHAVFQGYGNLIDRSQYPQFVMYLTIPPHLVDINVHPTKMEVRFSNERVIFHLFLSAVRKAIQTDKIVPDFSLRGGKEDAGERELVKQFRTNRPFAPRNVLPLNRPVKDEPPVNQLTFSYTLPEKPESDDFPSPGEAVDEDDDLRQPPLWQVHRRYILSQIKSGLVVIDQHVAHERVLFEKILNYISNGKRIPSQQLLFPQTLELALEDYLIFTEIKEWLSQIGFQFTELSGRTLLIESIPGDVKVGYEGKILLEIIDYYRENEGGKYQPHEKIAAAFACKNAIKSGDKLTQKEMASLIDQLFATSEPYFCPHGRPVIVTLNLEEFDKKFKRI